MTGLTFDSLEINVKRISITEVDLVVPLFDQYRVFYKQISDFSLAKSFLQARLSNNESVIFIASGDDRPLGFTQLYPVYSSVKVVKNWILNDLFVGQPYRKLGIGTLLIDAAFHFAKTENANYIQIETAFDNSNAQRLYESVGFMRHLPGNEFFVYRKILN
jgi:GNAT superfamily N-acetyltransferase